MKERKKCPFCGGKGGIDTLEAQRGKSGHKYRIWCLQCQASTGWKDSKEEAWAAWDQRVSGRLSESEKETARIMGELKKGGK